MALFFSPLLTNYVESDAFRVKMEEETAKGLHFPRGALRADSTDRRTYRAK